MRRWKDDNPTILQTITIHPNRWMRETQRSVIRHYTNLPTKEERKEKRRQIRKLFRLLNNVGYTMLGFGVACMIFGCGRVAHAVVTIVTR